MFRNARNRAAWLECIGRAIAEQEAAGDIARMLPQLTLVSPTQAAALEAWWAA